ncbi:unnamed protein product [Effrenium voratum]|uniref:STAS domain-containing protein n=1 Tax=Effrenium voratum TaxID=2562239 RepID=A0AA36N5D1_9DINO|nr:unnamed protein product [Effrenium voratum]
MEGSLSPRMTSGGEVMEERRISRIADLVMPRAGMEFKIGKEANGSSNTLECVRQSVVARVPVLGWLPHYDFRRDFFYDFVGGATIALICLVQTLAHAAIATTKVIQGPYCAFVPPFVYAMLGTSPHASISSGAIAAILLADQLQFWHDEEERTELASLLALISGGWLVAMGLCQAAYAVRFLSQSLISGFVTGGSVLILVGQMRNLLGLINMRHAIGFTNQVSAIIGALPEIHVLGTIWGIAMIIVLQLLMWLKKYLVAQLKKPGPHPGWMQPAKVASEMKELVLVFISILFAYSTCLEDGETRLPVVGDIPAGLPKFMPAWDYPASRSMLDTHFRLKEFCVGGFLVALTSFLTTYATSKKQALQHGYHIDASQEMFALGMAGVCGSFYGSFTPSGSLSRTSLASEVGVKTQMSGLMKLVVVGGSLQFLTPVLYYLPKATLAAIILRSTWQLVDLHTPTTLWSSWKPYHRGGMKRDFIVWWIAFLLTIFKGVLWGIGVAVGVSLIMIVHDAAVPRVVKLGRLESLGNIWRDQEIWPEGRTFQGIMVIEFRGPLSFASADHFMEEVENKRLLEEEAGNHIGVIVLPFGSVHDLDKTAIEMLRELLTEWRKRDISCIVADAKSRVRLLLEEHFGGGKAPLLNQQAFMIGFLPAVWAIENPLEF